MQELLERVTYLEIILQHKVNGIALDVDSLRRMARALDEHEQSKIRAANPLRDDEDPIEDEVCTIDPIEDTTTRKFIACPVWVLLTSQTTLASFRTGTSPCVSSAISSIIWYTGYLFSQLILAS